MTKNMKTRISLKYDTLSNWQNSGLKLRPGEIALAYIREEDENIPEGIYAGSVLYKCGMGDPSDSTTWKLFSNLPWGSALAADVDSWARLSEAEFANTFLNLKLSDGTTINDKLTTLFATKDELTTAVNAINAEIERATKAENAIDAKVEEIKKDYLKAADKEELQNQINTIVNNPDTEGIINSINEFTQYIEDHGDIAEGFRTDIDKNKEDITKLQAKEIIVDVVELPTSDINPEATYRILNGTFVLANLLRNDSECYIVDEVPTEAGEPVIKTNPNGDFSYTGYYNINDNIVYGYFDQASIDALKSWVDSSDLNEIAKIAIKGILNSMSTGWKTMEDIISSIGSSISLEWGGVIADLAQATNEDALYLYLSSEMFINRHNTWISADNGIGMPGEGIGAEIFNSPDNIATGLASHAEGRNTQATADAAHAEGFETIASGKTAHAEGEKTEASGYTAHAEGYDTLAEGQASHAEGTLTEATGPHAHAEGYETKASGSASHASGIRTEATGDAQTVIGKHNVTDSDAAFIIGNGTDAEKSNAMTVDWSGNIEVQGKILSEGKTLATENYVDNQLTNYATSRDVSTAFYNHYIRAGWNAAGYKKLGEYATVEGINNEAEGIAAHAEGEKVQANGAYTHAEGYDTKATGDFAHVEGVSSIASGQVAHAQGLSTQATGLYAHSEGESTIASGHAAHAEGKGTIAAGTTQHAQGLYNIEDAEGKYLHIVGNGSDEDNRSNAHTIDWEGNAEFAGTVKSAGNMLATENYVDAQISEHTHPTPDWNQNDETAPDYIKNRTHYSEFKEAEIDVIPTTTKDVPVVQEETGICCVQVEGLGVNPPTSGTYYVTFNGVEYQCEAYYVEGFIMIGEAHPVEEDYGNGEPFLVLLDENGEFWALYTYNLPGANTVSVKYKGITEVVNKIDKKYLPDIPEYSAAPEGGLKLDENNAFSIDDTIEFIFDCGGAGVIK